MGAFSDARKEMTDASNKRDSIVMQTLALVPYIVRNHWDAGLAILATRYFYGEDDFGGLIDFFNSAIERIA